MGACRSREAVAAAAEKKKKKKKGGGGKKSKAERKKEKEAAKRRRSTVRPFEKKYKTRPDPTEHGFVSHMVRVRKPTELIEDHYEVAATKIGQGGCGYTTLAWHKKTGHQYAVKRLHGSSGDESRAKILSELCEEIEKLMDLDHPHILRPLELWPGEYEVSFVMELCTGGELKDRPLPYEEAVTARVIGQVAQAVAYMHEKGVIHQDLKSENVLWRTPAADSDVVLIDFGISARFDPANRGEKLRFTGAGTIPIMAPEFFLEKEFDKSVDCFAIGVLTFLLLANALPFPGPFESGVDRALHVERLLDERYDPLPLHVSPAAEDFVRRLLKAEATDRMTAADAARHTFAKKTDAHPFPGRETQRKRTDAFRAFGKSTRFRKIALSVVAYTADNSDEDIRDLRMAFKRIETKGVVTAESVMRAFEDRSLPMPEGSSLESIAKLLQDATVDTAAKHLSYNNFLAATIASDRGRLYSDATCRAAFDRLDINDSGKIEVEDLAGFVSPHDDPVALIAAHDLDKDGAIDYAEFLALLREHAADSEHDENDDEFKSSAELPASPEMAAAAAATAALAPPLPAPGGGGRQRQGSATLDTLAESDDESNHDTNNLPPPMRRPSPPPTLI